MLTKEVLIPDQQRLWNEQHATRGVNLEGSSTWKFTPNTSAIEFGSLLNPRSTILEIGSANGRDARYWANQSHDVYAIDFSEVALDQLSLLAIEQGIESLITPILWNISCGSLPLSKLPHEIDGLYARSALHIDNTSVFNFAFNADKLLKPGAVVYIEGKGPNDQKISRSHNLGNGLFIDYKEKGHLRRSWTGGFARKLCDHVGWHILNLQEKYERWNGSSATFMRLSARKSYY